MNCRTGRNIRWTKLPKELNGPVSLLIEERDAKKASNGACCVVWATDHEEQMLTKLDASVGMCTFGPTANFGRERCCWDRRNALDLTQRKKLPPKLDKLARRNSDSFQIRVKSCCWVLYLLVSFFLGQNMCSHNFRPLTICLYLVVRTYLLNLLIIC
jgi:hypothetical protein